MKINLNGEDSKVVKSNETYDVIDNTSLNKLVVSKTILHVGKETGGHNHTGQEEVYIFMGNNKHSEGKMVVGSNTYIVKSGDIILIPDGEFHKVWNTADENLGEFGDLEFICVFDGGRNH